MISIIFLFIKIKILIILFIYDMQDDLLADINDILKGCSLPKMRRDTICAYGVTGSGKSTLINYLLNNEMKYEKNFGKFCIEKVNNDQKGPDVGNTMISETTRP